VGRDWAIAVAGVLLGLVLEPLKKFISRWTSIIVATAVPGLIAWALFPDEWQRVAGPWFAPVIGTIGIVIASVDDEIGLRGAPHTPAPPITPSLVIGTVAAAASTAIQIATSVIYRRPVGVAQSNKASVVATKVMDMSSGEPRTITKSQTPDSSADDQSKP
jgi:hypothetical protein